MILSVFYPACKGVQEPDPVGLQEPVVNISFQPCISRYQVGSLNSAMVGILMPQ